MMVWHTSPGDDGGNDEGAREPRGPDPVEAHTMEIGGDVDWDSVVARTQAKAKEVRRVSLWRPARSPCDSLWPD